MDLTQKTETFQTPEDLSWLGKDLGFDDMDSITLDASAFSLTTFADGFIPSGVVLGKISASGKYGPYDGGASDGTEVAAGFLGTTVAFTAQSGDNISGALLWIGEVVEANLPADNGVDSGAKADLTHIRFV